MRYVPHVHYTRSNLADRMVWLFFLITKPGHCQIRLRQGAAGEDQTCCLFRVGQGEPAVFQQIDISVNQTRLAGAATAGSAAMRVVDALFEGCFQNGLGRGNLNGPVRLIYSDLP